MKATVALKLRWRALGTATLSELAGIGLLASAGALLAWSAQQPAWSSVLGLLILVEALAFSRAPIRYGSSLIAHAVSTQALGQRRHDLVVRLGASVNRFGAMLTTGDALERLITDASVAAERDQRVLVPRVQALAFLVVASSFALAVESLAGFVLLITGLSIFALNILTRRISHTSARASNARRKLTSSAAEFLEGRDELEMLSAARFAKQRFRRANAHEQSMATQDATARRYYIVACSFVAATGSFFAAGLLGASSGIASLAALVVVLGTGEALGLWTNASLATISSIAAASSIETLPQEGVKSHEVPLAKEGSYLLEAQNISVEGIGGECLLDPISLRLARGSFIAIVGPSGAGKSTLLAALGGLAELASGSVSVHGVDLSGLSDEARSKLVAFVGHEDGILSGTVRDLLSMGRRDLEDEALEEALEHVGLADELRDRGGLESPLARGGQNFSTGERRRLVLARAIATSAPIWLLDEPCAGLDPDAADALVAMIATLGSSRAIVMVTHRDQEAGLAHERWHIAHGRVQHAN